MLVPEFCSLRLHAAPIEYHVAMRDGPAALAPAEAIEIAPADDSVIAIRHLYPGDVVAFNERVVIIREVDQDVGQKMEHPFDGRSRARTSKGHLVNEVGGQSIELAMPLGGAGVITGVGKFRVRPVTHPGTPIENFRNRLFTQK